MTHRPAAGQRGDSGGQAARRAPSVAGRAASGEKRTGAAPLCPVRRAAGTSPTRCQSHRIRSRAASGWSPNSRAIRLTQPLMSNCPTVRLIASATAAAVGASDGCSPDALTPRAAPH